MEASMRQILVAALVVGFAAGLGAQEPVRPGPGVTLPTVIRQVKPDYTPEAQAARIQGRVLLGVVVLADGSVDAITVDRSLDATYGLDQQAVKAMKEWKFKPGTKDGKAVPVRINVEMTFTLK
jgi:periplasmic protein TonB